MLLPRFELHRPSSVDEALTIAARHAGDCDFIAGGTDLLQNYKNRLNPRGHVVSLLGIDALQELSPTRIGALTTLARIEESETMRRELPILVEAASKVASPLVRQTATLGGNLLVETRCYYFNQSEFWRRSKGYCLKAEGDVCLVVPQKETCYAAFSGDMAPALMALGASARLKSLDGERIVKLTEFYEGDGIKRYVLRPGELVQGVELPPSATSLRGAYRKLRLRDTFDYPELGLAVTLGMEGEKIRELHVCAAAMETVPLCFDDLTGSLHGQPLSDSLIQLLGERIVKRVKPVKNTALSPNYRRKMVMVYLRRMLEQLATAGN